MSAADHAIPDVPLDRDEAFWLDSIDDPDVTWAPVLQEMAHGLGAPSAHDDDVAWSDVSCSAPLGFELPLESPDRPILPSVARDLVAGLPEEPQDEGRAPVDGLAVGVALEGLRLSDAALELVSSEAKSSEIVEGFRFGSGHEAYDGERVEGSSKGMSLQT